MKEVICLTAMIAGLSTAAVAQQAPTDDPVASAPIRFGPVGIEPRVGVTNVGVDTNVFYDAVDPKSDFTFTATPGVKLWLRTGHGLLSIDGNLDLVYFNKYSSERSVNSFATGKYRWRFNRLQPYVSAGTVNARDRPGFEIDERVRHYETDFHAGTDIRVASKGAVRFDLRDRDYTIADDEFYQGRQLSQELNRTLKVADLSWRQRFTSMTTWVTRVSQESERFQHNDLRNSDSFRVSSGFELGQRALIRGSAFVGYRSLKPADGGELPEFSGVTADVNVAYTAPSQSRLSGVVTRDVQYSYERRTPYYLQTGWRLALTQRVVGKWDAQITGGRDRLAYQALAIFPAEARTDFVNQFGGGVGYLLGEATRISFDWTSHHRTSDLPGREYNGTQAGISVTYGF